MPPDRKNGTSAPMVAPTSRSRVIGAPPHNRASATARLPRRSCRRRARPRPGSSCRCARPRRESLRPAERRPQRRRGFPDKVARVERHVRRLALERERPRLLAAHQRVVQLDRLEHGAQLVIAVGADAEHPQVEIDFRVARTVSLRRLAQLVMTARPLPPQRPRTPKLTPSRQLEFGSDSEVRLRECAFGSSSGAVACLQRHGRGDGQDRSRAVSVGVDVHVGSVA